MPCAASARQRQPSRYQALVAVQAVSLNFGEIAGLALRSQPGDVPRWDTAGVVVQAAADGSGPPAGSRMVTFGWTGGWPSSAAVPTADLAVVPDGVDLGAASTVAVGGVTALQVLRGLGSMLARRVLVTGASGGVGRFAVQLAALAGAEVVARVRVMHRAGGPQLAEAFTHLESGGVVQWFGIASCEPAP